MTGSSLQDQKRRLRREMKLRRASLADREQRSLTIQKQAWGSLAFRQARSVLCYVSVRDEVQTQTLLQEAWNAGKVLAVPYCSGGELVLVRLESMAELVPRTLGILEPNDELLADPRRALAPQELDLVLVPGLAFDRQGGRLGYGKGYYDKLLNRVRPECRTLGLGFECQVVESVPREPHDISMQGLITEAGERSSSPE